MRDYVIVNILWIYLWVGADRGSLATIRGGTRRRRRRGRGVHRDVRQFEAADVLRAQTPPSPVGGGGGCGRGGRMGRRAGRDGGGGAHAAEEAAGRALGAEPHARRVDDEARRAVEVGVAPEGERLERRARACATARTL